MYILPYIIIIICLVPICMRYTKGKATIGWLTALYILSPSVPVGEGKTDSLYFVLMILLVCVTLKNKGKLLLSNARSVKPYAGLMIFTYSVYLLSWLIFNRNNESDLIPLYAGFVKNLLFLLLTMAMNGHIESEELSSEFSSALLYLTLINCGVSILQWLNSSIGLELIRVLRSDASYRYAVASIRNGLFRRCFGMMTYPMDMGIFSLLAFTYALYMPWTSKRIVLMGLTVITGILSATKSYVIGVASILLVWSVVNVYFDKVKLKTLLLYVSLACATFIFFVNFDVVYRLVYNTLGSNYARYLSFLKNLSEVFASRYGEESVYLGYMPDFLKKYWLMGAGPVPLDQERIIDSSFYEILHNGGIIALIPIVVYYAVKLFQYIRFKNACNFFLLFAIFISGVGFQMWTISRMSTIFMLYILMNEELVRKSAVRDSHDGREDFKSKNKPLF